jgi:hypothetical protein
MTTAAIAFAKQLLLARSCLHETSNWENIMKTSDVLGRIKRAIETSPRNGYVAELHLQTIKYADDLEGITGREFCDALGIGTSFGTEFAKMRKIAPRLKKAGLDVDRL